MESKEATVSMLKANFYKEIRGIQRSKDSREAGGEKPTAAAHRGGDKPQVNTPQVNTPQKASGN